VRSGKRKKDKTAGFFPAFFLFMLFVHCTLYTVHCQELLLNAEGKLLSPPPKSAPYAKALASAHMAQDSPQNTIRRMLDSLGYHEQAWVESGDTLRVVPGPRFYITEIEIEGGPQRLDIPESIFMPSLSFYNAGVIRETMRGLSRFFSENGYPYNKIAVSVDIRDSAALGLRFIVDTDERVCNGAAVIKGVKKRPQKYLKDVRLFEGEPYSGVDADETLRRLSMRPYVRYASIGSPVVIEDAPLCHDSMRQAVSQITIVEKTGLDMEGVLGYESSAQGKQSGLSGRLDLSFLNLLGFGESATVGYMGTNSLQRLRMSVSRPWVFGLPLEMGGGFELEIEDEGYGFLCGEFWTTMEINGRWKAGIALRGSETVPPDSIEPAYKFYGTDLFLTLISQPWQRGKTVKELSMKTGSGLANREKTVTRGKMEFAAGIHQPIFTRYALAGRISGKTLFTDENYLSPSETYRIGGHNSLRGYSEEEFAFRSVLFSQAEALLYFDQSSSIFIFFDSGIGFDQPGKLLFAEGQKMFGYGAGLRFPSRLGTVSLEWGRNLDDGSKGLGRIHVGIKTGLL
jgi:outer membrane protein assembly factor BamA